LELTVVPCARPRHAGLRSTRSRKGPDSARHAAGSRWPDQDQERL